MTGPARARKLRYVTVDIIPLRSLLLALFFVLGIVCGYVYSGRCALGTGEELRRYFEGYLDAQTRRGVTAEAAAQTLACFLRAPVLAFLLGFASLGVAAIPLLCAAEGFVASFSLFCFAAALGRQSFAVLPALFALRLLFVLPCTLLLGTAALEKSCALALLSWGGGKRARPIVYGTAYWYRFAACCVCLLIGCALELWLTPLLLAAQ